MPKKARPLESRVYPKRGRFYADFRDFGAGQVALRAKGETRATDDFTTALDLAGIRLAELEAARRDAARIAVERSRADAHARVLGFDPSATLGAFADRHLALMAESGRYSRSWLESVRRNLTSAVVFFDVEQRSDSRAWAARGIPDGPRLLATVSAPDVAEFLRWLETQPNGRGGTLGPQSRLHAISALSKLFRRAISEGRSSRNPVSELLDRPAPPKSTTPLYEAEEVCLILESARIYEARHFDDFETAASCIHALLATFAYTGGRWSEVMALEIEDARRDLRDGLLTLVTSKTERYGSLPRTVQVPPALVDVLSAHIRRTGRLAGPLFATVDAAGDVNRLGDVRKTLARVAEQIGRGPDYIRGKPLRVSWTTHYSTVNGISIHDVRDAGGWANLKQLALVYGRARKRRVSMGDQLDFSVERWGDLVERELEALYNAPGGPPAPNGRRNEEGEAQRARERLQETAARATERTQVVRSFLRAVHGLTDYHASVQSGVDRAAIRRARMASDPSKVHTATVEKMRAALTRIAPAAMTRAS